MQPFDVLLFLVALDFLLLGLLLKGRYPVGAAAIATAIWLMAMLMPKPRKSGPMSPDTVTAVFDRAQNHCEGCGKPAYGFMHIHHRRLRSGGGKDDLANLLWLHDGCHRWAHDHPKYARELGWIVSRYGEGPEEIPVKKFDPNEASR